MVSHIHFISSLYHLSSDLIEKNTCAGVGFTEEHFVTIEAGQSDPNGPVLSNPDSSLTGSVKVEKSCAGKKT